MYKHKRFTRRQFLLASLAVVGGLSSATLRRTLAGDSATEDDSFVYFPFVSRQPRGSPRGWYLNEFNTGLAGLGIDRATLPLYTGSDTPADGAVIRDVRIETQLDLSAGAITLERCWIHPLSIGRGLPIIWNYHRDTGTVLPISAFIRDCDIDCSAVSSADIGWSAAFGGSGVIERCHIWGAGSGLWLRGVSPIAVKVEGNYIHGLRHSPPDSHQDGITLRDYSGPEASFLNNRVDSSCDSETGPFFLQAGFGYIDNVYVEGNFLEGNVWKLMLEAHTYGYGSNMRAYDNRFRNTGFGAAYVAGGPGWAEWRENYLDDPTQVDHKGAAVPQPFP